MTVYERRAQAVRRGDIYYISNNRGQIGSEMKKDRPAVVVSNDMNNRHSNEITLFHRLLRVLSLIHLPEELHLPGMHHGIHQGVSVHLHHPGCSP